MQFAVIPEPPEGGPAEDQEVRPGLAQALYEKHKVLTYPRTDSRALPEDYLGTVKKTMDMLGGQREYAPLLPETSCV